MPHVTGNTDVPNLAAELLAAVLHHPQDVAREIERVGSLSATAPEEEWEVLSAVACSLRESSARRDRRPPAAEIHLLRHLAARHQ